MKKIFFYIIAFFPVTIFAQSLDNFSINCKVENLKPIAKAYLVYQLGANRIIDSAEIVNSSFNFKGQIIYPTNAFLVVDHIGIGFSNLDNTADVLSFYLEKGEFSIISPDSVSKAKITGSKINDDNIKLMGQLKPLFADAQRIKEEEKSAPPVQKNSAGYQNKVQAQLKQIQTAEKATLKVFILGNPDSYLSLLALSSVGGPSPDPAELDTLYSSLSPRLKETETAKVFKNALNALKYTAIGVTAPDFTETDVTGQLVKLSSFRGKYVLLDFWASWCGPCRQENPNVVKAFNKYKDKNFTILGVSLDREGGKADWIAAIQNDGLNWTQVSDLKFWKSQVAALYYVTSIPANFLIDPNGKIIAKNLRGNDLEDKLAEVLAK